ncbi:variable large family protein (plasmid) [Borrelia parkeri]|uniref:variable large family protein n=1 Tax=Borrelia parkeri TaxID=141 RepID=UPI001FF1F803|nr:variable large family protein [Borrelia parkeri]UPA11494.1 variable large family protein [Borrelia parkeri]UPA11586.1 variable large family protein [Borrelia parkeri]UPA11639.1 variable large family protein [Borrelia parkeri]
MMKRITFCALLMTLFLLLSCGSGQLQAEKLAAESKNTFLDSLVKIGHGFYEIFGVFGNAIGDALGFTAVKSGDQKSKVGEHFGKIKKGLVDTNGKLKELSDEISEAKNANSSTIKLVEDAINSASDVIAKLIDSVTKMASITNDSSSIGDNVDNPPAAAEEVGVDTIIKSVSSIIEVAKKSGIEIKPGNVGNQIAVAANATDAIAVLGGHTAKASAGAGDKLAVEVSKADPWAMIDKIKNAKATAAAKLNAGTDNEAGALAASNNNADAGAGAKSNADLAAAVALKAMTKGGKFSANAADTEAVKSAAVTAVNKVLGVLDFIIRKTVSSNLDKIREAVKGIQYSETTTESAEASSTTQPAAAK